MAVYSETQLIQGCLRGDRTFQKRLHELYYSEFLKVCIRYAKTPEDAEQLLNDSFLKIFGFMHTYQNKGSFEGWMRRIVVNVCLDYLKSAQLKNYNRMQLSQSETALEISIPAEVISQLSFKELLLYIQSLPPVSKTVFNLYVFDGFSHREIAAVLRITESTSSWHLHHARKVLREKLMLQDQKQKHEAGRF